MITNYILLSLLATVLSNSDYFYFDLIREDYVPYYGFYSNSQIVKPQFSTVNVSISNQSQLYSVEKGALFKVPLETNYEGFINNIVYTYNESTRNNFIKYEFVNNSIFPNDNENKNLNVNSETLSNVQLMEETLHKNSKFDNSSPLECYYFVFGPNYNLSIDQYHNQVTNVIHSKYFNYAIEKNTKQIVIFQVDEENSQIINYNYLCFYYNSPNCASNFDKIFLPTHTFQNWNSSIFYLIGNRNGSTISLFYKIYETPSQISFNGEYEIDMNNNNIELLTYNNIYLIAVSSTGFFNFYFFNMDIPSISMGYNQIFCPFVDFFIWSNYFFGLDNSAFRISRIEELQWDCNSGTLLQTSLFGGRNIKFDYIKNESLKETTKISFGIVTENELIECMYYQGIDKLYIMKIIKFPSSITSKQSLVTDSINSYSFINTNSQLAAVKRNIPYYSFSYGAKLNNLPQNTDLYELVSVNQKPLIGMIDSNIALLSDFNINYTLQCSFNTIGLYKLHYTINEDCSYVNRTYNDSMGTIDIWLSLQTCPKNYEILYTVNEKIKENPSENDYNYLKKLIIATLILVVILLFIVTIVILFIFLCFPMNKKKETSIKRQSTSDIPALKNSKDNDNIINNGYVISDNEKNSSKDDENRIINGNEKPHI